MKVSQLRAVVYVGHSSSSKASVIHHADGQVILRDPRAPSSVSRDGSYRHFDVPCCVTCADDKDGSEFHRAVAEVRPLCWQGGYASTMAFVVRRGIHEWI